MSRYAAALIGLLVAPAVALAAPTEDKSAMISKVAAKKAALAEVQGQITSSRLTTVDGQPVYYFYIAAPNQPVQVVRVSGTTGKVL